MKIYKTQEEVNADIKDGVLSISGDVKFECSISIEATIVVDAGNINASNINAVNIDAWDINAWDINAVNINAGNINAWDINARNINARNINAVDINAGNILYFAFCCVYQGIQCLSIKAKREIHQKPICLEGKLEIKKDVKDN
jgi:hypothetical protein